MKITISTIVLAAMTVVVLAAPAPLPASEPEARTSPLHREKRSHYAPASYSSPCAAASAHLPPVYLPSPPLHAYSLAPPHAMPLNLASYGYAEPHYRAHDDVLEDAAMFAHMQHSGADHAAMARTYGGYEAPAAAPHYRAHDLLEDPSMSAHMDHTGEEHAAMARTYGGYEAPATAYLGGSVAYGHPAVSSGPAMGVFPHAKVGGCNVPLLLSCSPSIVTGRLVHANPHYGYGGVSSGSLYRGIEEPMPEMSGEEMHSFEPLRDSHGLHAANIQTQAEGPAAHAAQLATHSAHIKQGEDVAVQAMLAAANAAHNHDMTHN